MENVQQLDTPQHTRLQKISSKKPSTHEMILSSYTAGVPKNSRLRAEASGMVEEYLTNPEYREIDGHQEFSGE